MTIDEIATAALDIHDDQEREVFLDRQCGADQTLREKVAALIRALRQADEDDFLGSGLFAVASDAAAPSSHQNAFEPASTNEAWVEKTSDRFVLRDKHAIGGLGEVWVAWDRQLGREVALKQIRPEWSTHRDAEARFRREAEITGYLEHPGVVPIYSLGQGDDGRPFYAMQFIRGRTLEQVVTEHLAADESGERSDLPWYETSDLRELLNRFVAVCNTIDYAHSRNIVHRDLKPANIMLGEYGQTLVVDWGLAKRMGTTGPSSPETSRDPENRAVPTSENGGSSVDETRHGATLGTPRFMSPEQAAGQTDHIGPATDIYCLGGTLYFLLTGSPPHVGEPDLESTFRKIVSGHFRPPVAVRPQVPPALQAIVLKAMETEPNHRYQTAGALGAEVNRYLADQALSVFRDPPVERLLRWTRKNPATAAGSVVTVLLTFFVVIAGLLLHQEMTRRQTEADRRLSVRKREIEFEKETRRLETVALTSATLQRTEAAIGESRFADAASLLQVAIERMKSQPTLDPQRNRLIAKRDRLAKLGEFESLFGRGAAMQHLGRDTETAILFQQALGELGVWDSHTWWDDLPVEDLSAQQADRLRWEVYRVLTALNSLYAARMVEVMGGTQNSGTPSSLQMLRSYLSGNKGVAEARASLELTRRIQLFRPSEAARWLSSIAGLRLRQGSRVKPAELGPPQNPPDGLELAIYSLIASADAGYRNWFKDYGKTFMEFTDEPPAQRYIDVAQEAIRRVSDQAVEDYWIRLTLAQTYFLQAQQFEQDNDYQKALERYELARSEYGRCIAIDSDAPFGFADRSTVALRQAVLMRDHPSADDYEQERANQLLQDSFRDATHARRIAPNEYWIFWHIGATAIELGRFETAVDAFVTAVEKGFYFQQTLGTPIVRLDDFRGRAAAIEFAKQFSSMTEETEDRDPRASRYAMLQAALDFSQQDYDSAVKRARKAVLLDPQNLRAIRLAGWCELKRGETDSARNHFQTGLAMDPTDPVLLVGLAQTHENDSQDSNTDTQDTRSDTQCLRYFQKVTETEDSIQPRSAAWLGIARHHLRQGQLDDSFQAINKARQLGLALDLSLFPKLATDQARALVVVTRKTRDEAAREQSIEKIKALKRYIDQVSELPTASVNQILESASPLPPRRLAVLGGAFELPLDRYWTLRPVNDEDEAVASQPPIDRVPRPDSTNNYAIRIAGDEERGSNTSWVLQQTVSALPGTSYRVAVIMRRNTPEPSRERVTLTVQHQEETLARLDSETAGNEWTVIGQHWTVPETESDYTSVNLLIKVPALTPGTTIWLDDVTIEHVPAE
jgi:serine/threonine protein kinase/tetratricopeptide (TPR) repeat protein